MSNTLYCSFCGLSQHEVRRLMFGPNVFVCNECIDMMHEIVHSEDKPTAGKRSPLSHHAATPSVASADAPPPKKRKR